MDKYNYSTLKKLGKDELIYLITILEREIRKEYEKFTVPPLKFYYMIEELFKEGKNLKPVSHEAAITILIAEALRDIYLNPVLLKLMFNDRYIDFPLTDIEDENDRKWAGDLLRERFWDIVIIENVKQVICVNGSGVNEDERSGATPSIEDHNLVCRLNVYNNKVTLRELTELVYRIKSSKFDFWYELFEGISTHIDDKGTLFIQARFDHGS